MRQDEAAIVVGPEDADPTVEKLHEVGAGRDLHVEIIRGRAREQSPSGDATSSGSVYIMVLVAWYWREPPPSIRYDARVKGAPANPISGVVARARDAPS